MMTTKTKIRIFAILVVGFVFLVMVSICVDMSDTGHKPSPIVQQK